MGVILDNFTTQLNCLDFKAVDTAAARSLGTLIPELLPGGKRVAKDWVCCNPTREDMRASLSVSFETGAWYDFATKDRGKTFASLVAYITNVSFKEANFRLAGQLGVKGSTGSTSLTGNIRSFPQQNPPAPSAAAPADARLGSRNFSPRTPPDHKGKPSFFVAGDEGPRTNNREKRRHVYCSSGVPRRVKILLKDGGAYNVYRVADVDGTTGWQYKKPDGFLETPYFKGSDPFDADGLICWPEGERDVDTLADGGLPAFTFGGCGDGLPAGCEEYVRGRHVVVLADNDTAGREHAEEKAALAATVAASVRVVHFAELDDKQDVSDWIAAGHTYEELKARIEVTETWPMKAEKSADHMSVKPAQGKLKKKRKPSRTINRNRMALTRPRLLTRMTIRPKSISATAQTRSIPSLTVIVSLIAG